MSFIDVSVQANSLVRYHASTPGGRVLLTKCNYHAGAERMCDAVEDMTGQRPWVLFKLCWRYVTPLICLVSHTLLTAVGV